MSNLNIFMISRKSHIGLPVLEEWIKTFLCEGLDYVDLIDLTNQYVLLARIVSMYCYYGTTYRIKFAVYHLFWSPHGVSVSKQSWVLEYNRLRSSSDIGGLCFTPPKHCRFVSTTTAANIFLDCINSASFLISIFIYSWKLRSPLRIY